VELARRTPCRRLMLAFRIAAGGKKWNLISVDFLNAD
jgi:hypothetical protein